MSLAVRAAGFAASLIARLADSRACFRLGVATDQPLDIEVRASELCATLVHMTNPRAGDQLDAQLDQRLGTSAPELAALQDGLYESYSAGAWGLRQFAGILNEEDRAVASDLVLSAAEGIQVNLREMALCAMDVLDLVGPNGRTMPGPKTTVEDVISSKRLHRAITDFARAFGSTLDCLAAVSIGVLGLPKALQYAGGGNLLSLPVLPSSAPEDQVAARADIEGRVSSGSAGPPAGWLQWMLELRDAVVHRGHLTQTWLPRPPRLSARFFVRSEEPAHRLVRFEPHLRGQPWQPDMFSLTQTGTDIGRQRIWLPEPAQVTLRETRQRMQALSEDVCTGLRAALERKRSDWVLPARQWHLERGPQRARTSAAESFEGFVPSYAAPPPSTMRVHPRSAARLALAERIRKR